MMIVWLLQKWDFGEIQNPCLAILVEKTMRWSFTVEHMPGAQNLGPDALSRYPVGPGTAGSGYDMLGDIMEDGYQARSDDREAGVITSVIGRPGVKFVTWSNVREVGMSNPDYMQLLTSVGGGLDSWYGLLTQYKRFKDNLSLMDGVVLFKGA